MVDGWASSLGAREAPRCVPSQSPQPAIAADPPASSFSTLLHLPTLLRPPVRAAPAAALFRLIGYSAKNMALANSSAMLCLLLMIITNGFSIVYPAIPPYMVRLEEGAGWLVAWRGVVWCGVVWCGVVWCGVVWCGVVRCVCVFVHGAVCTR